MRRVWLAALAALAVYFVAVALGAVIVSNGTGTLDGRATGWVTANLIAAALAGFAGCRAAVGAPRAARFAAAIAGPALLSLVFTLTTNARDSSGLWLAFAATILGAAAGAALRDGVGRAQRRRAA